MIGVLGVQGAVSEHQDALSKIGVENKIVASLADLKGIDGIVIPGGESTTIRKLLVRLNMLNPLHTQIQNGLPVLGTCAGLVLLAQPDSLDGIAGEVARNGFGRQQDSFEDDIEIAGFNSMFHSVFIRAPYLKSVGSNVDVLARLADGKIVAAQQDNVLVTAFHPELTSDTRLHQYFVHNFI